MPLEQQLLPAPELKEHYGSVTWLFVSRNFKDDVVDREALRTHDRFGITSWPQMVIFDPRDDTVLQEMPRDLPGFVVGLKKHTRSLPQPSAADRAVVEKLAAAAKLGKEGNAAGQKAILEAIAAGRDGVTGWLRARELLRGDREQAIEEQLADPDVRERCIGLERIADLPADAAKRHGKAVVARLADADEHLTVRLRAMRQLVKTDPQQIAKNAAQLLAVPNDPFRYAVLDVVTEHPDAKLAAPLLHIFDAAGAAVPSVNPNVLRMHAAKALGAVGDQRAVVSLAEVTRRADPRNGLTGTAIDALVAIAARVDAKGRAEIAAALLESFPADLESAGLDGFGERAERMLLALAQRVQAALAKVTGKSLPALPAHWSKPDRVRHLAAVKRIVVG